MERCSRCEATGAAHHPAAWARNRRPSRRTRARCRRRATCRHRRTRPSSWARVHHDTVAAPRSPPMPPPSPYAGRPAPASILVDVGRLVAAYHDLVPDLSDPAQRVAFGTSGHRGSSLKGAFNETHIRAITQAICDHRKAAGVDGPLFFGRDTHALSIPATRTALEVLVGNGVHVIVDDQDRPLPTPVLSHAVITHNRGRTAGLADAIVVTPSHNPPEDGGVKSAPAPARTPAISMTPRPRAWAGRPTNASTLRRPTRRKSNWESSIPTSSTPRVGAASRSWRTDPRSRQRPADRRAQGGHGKRLVRSPSIGNRRHLQDIRRELPERRAT